MRYSKSTKIISLKLIRQYIQNIYIPVYLVNITIIICKLWVTALEISNLEVWIYINSKQQELILKANYSNNHQYQKPVFA